MRRSTIVLGLVFAVAATGVGIVGGMILSQVPRPPSFAGQALPTDSGGATELDATTTAASSSTLAPTTTAPATISVKLARRLEDGVELRIDASEPVTATLEWGVGRPNLTLPVHGRIQHQTVKLPLDAAVPVQVRVRGLTQDGRQATSPTISVRRLLRQVTLRLTEIQVTIPGGTAALQATFLGMPLTLLRNGAAPAATAAPAAFPPAPVPPGDTLAPLALRAVHRPPAGAPRSGSGTATVPLPTSPATPGAVSRDLAVADLRVHLTLLVTATVG